MEGIRPLKLLPSKWSRLFLVHYFGKKTGLKIIFKMNRGRLHLLMEEVTKSHTSLQNMRDSWSHLWNKSLNTMF